MQRRRSGGTRIAQEEIEKVTSDRKRVEEYGESSSGIGLRDIVRAAGIAPIVSAAHNLVRVDPSIYMTQELNDNRAH